MKNLNSYTEKAVSKLFDENGAFFAFSDKQFLEQKKPGVKYVRCGHGLICPKDNAKTVLDGLSKTRDLGIKQDIAENGKEAIIKRELYNYECFYISDYSDAVSALKPYGFTEDEIADVYHAEFPNVEF